MFRKAIELFWTRALLVLDALKWWHDTHALRQRPVPARSKTLLVVDLMTMISNAKVEALLTAALRRRGYRPVVLLPSSTSVIERIYKAGGTTEFVYLQNYLSDDLKEQARVEAERCMAAIPDLQELVELEIDGYRTGRNVQSYVVRRFRTGRLDSRNEAHRSETRRLLADALAIRLVVPRLLEDTHPDLALFCERGYTPAGDIFDGCLLHGVDVIQWLGAPQSDRLLFKRYRRENRDTHPLALSTETWKKLQKMPWTHELEEHLLTQLASHYESGAWYNRQQLQEGKSFKSRQQIHEQLGLDPSKKTAVIFAHILYDATFFYGTSLFSDYEEWLVEAVRCAVANPNLNWIVKVHPVNVWRSRMDGVDVEQLENLAIHRAVGPLPPHVTILPADTDINTFSLYQAVDYGLTVRGTPGMELPCLGVPVVTAGTGRYSGRGFTMDPSTPEEFRATLAKLHQVPHLDKETMRRARLYAFGTFFMRPTRIVSFDFDFKANTYGLKALTQNVFINPATASQLEKMPDMARFLDWADGSNDIDLLDWDMFLDSSTQQTSEPNELPAASLDA
jgi:hypothetical protein